MTNQEKTQAALEAVGGRSEWSDVLVAIDNGRLAIDGKGKIWVNASGLKAQVDVTRSPEQNMLDNPELTDFLCELLVKK